MPPKPLPRTRTWGTRFDSLLSSPKGASLANKDRVATSDITSTAANENEAENPSSRKENKMPHDASIFVGSLPANIEQPELARLLGEHLSEHAEVKNIKVVRDSKGGICAFVQCESASSAASLIQTIHSSPARPFLGRFLRYEPARAFRTLLISYRTPTQFVPPGPPETDPSGKVTQKEGQTIELGLPTVMRIWKPHNTKYFNILYNAEAHNSHYQNKNVRDSNDDMDLLLQTLSFDADTIQRLCEFFGPLEHFKPFPEQNQTEDGLQERASFPYPHHAPRSPGMDPGCWEMKWEHRDDCVSALMTLRRVPHLTVTWAHHPHSQGYDQYQWHTSRLLHPNAMTYPFHTQDSNGQSRLARSVSVGPADQGSWDYAQHTSRFTQMKTSASDVGPMQSLLGASAKPSLQLEDTVAPLHTRDLSGSDSLDEISPPSQTPSVQQNLPVVKEEVPSTQWTETDFPPLSEVKGERRVESGAWSEKKGSEGAETLGESTAGLASMSGATSSSTQLSDISNGQKGAEADIGQDLEMPPTPEFGNSPNTPRMSFAQFPKTPTSAGYGGELRVVSSNSFESQECTQLSGDENPHDRVIDPTTIFVGGLEMYGPNAWNEAKVHSHFAKFGGVENVKVVRPANSRSAFAFVKFNNTEGPARAVSDEHNRILDGRPIRVQLKDCNPQNRTGWKYARNRGRFLPHDANRAGGTVSPDLSANHAGRENAPPAGAMAQHAQPSPGKPEADLRPPLADCSNNNLEAKSLPDISIAKDSIPSVQVHNVPKQEHTQDSKSVGCNDTASDLPANTTSEYAHYREWYEQESPPAPLTPPSSSLGSSASTSAPPVTYPLPPAGYFAPPWMPPYPYPVAFVPGYGYTLPVAHPPQPVLSPPGSDSNGSTASVQPWPAMGHLYPSFIPYTTYPTSQPPGQPAQPPSNVQAPVVPTGFMHGEQGTLIPVYPPDALDQYMSGNQPNVTTSQIQPVTQQAMWPAYPQLPTFGYAGPVPLNGIPMTSLPSQQFGTAPIQPSQSGNVGWTLGPSAVALLAQQQQSSHAAFVHPNDRSPGGAYRRPPYPGARSAQQGHHEQRQAPPPRRHRRDYDHNQNGHMGRNHNGYNRHTRSGGHGVNDHSHHAAQPASTGAVAEWTQWPSGRQA